MPATPRPYKIRLTADELDTLAWLEHHGYFPSETYNALSLEDETEPEDGQEGTYSLAEHEAWPILDWREEGADLYACATHSLLTKLLALEEEIV